MDANPWPKQGRRTNDKGKSIGGLLFMAVRSLLSFSFFLFPFSFSWAGPKPGSYWAVDDVQPGMKGIGRTVLKGTKIETFDAEVLGVLKNTSPGRDLILCRLSGLNLEKTGVIAGMSGSPIYIDGKLLGAVAYAWPFGKEPIAGITPFCQMHGYVAAFERRDVVERGNKPNRVGLHKPVTLAGRDFEMATVSQGFDDPSPTSTDGLWLVPLRTPLCASGFTARSLALLRDRFRDTGLVPMQGGAATARVSEKEKHTPLLPGGSLAVSLVTGDFDLSGIGTVTHVEDKRVYGWGHPFMAAGACDLPLMTGYVHTIYPRQTVSFKMGSPLRTVGVINADVSTCIAGWLDQKPDMLPVDMRVTLMPDGETKKFNVQVARMRPLVASLVFTVLTNSVDMEGELPEELTADLQARIEIEGHSPIMFKDTYSGSGYSSNRAPQAMYSQIASVVSLLTYNTHKPVRIRRIDCDTVIQSGRRSAEIEAAELASETYAPGGTLKATVFVRPYKGRRQQLPVELKLPADLPEGSYTATICDDVANARNELRDDPSLNYPQDLDQFFAALKVQTSAKRNNLVVRVPLPAAGVAVDGKSLPNLPPSMVQLLGNTRRTGAQPMSAALVSRQKTPWVIQGYESLRFTVTKSKKVISD